MRRARGEDAGPRRRLHQRAYAKYVERIDGKPEPMAADWSRVVGDESVWLLEISGRLTGAVVLRNQPDHLLIWSVAVDPASQGYGFGRQLLDFAEQEAHRLGHHAIRLYTNELFTENIRLYQAIGYVITRSESIGERTLVHMQKSIVGQHRT